MAVANCEKTFPKKLVIFGSTLILALGIDILVTLAVSLIDIGII